MFKREKNEQIWKDFVLSVVNKKFIVPLTNYHALKQAYFYIKFEFPDWNL